MATRFTYDPEPSVAPTGAPAHDYEDISASPEAFGASIARAGERQAGAQERLAAGTGKLGAGVESAGNAITDVATEWNKRQNQIHAAEVKNDFDQKLTPLHAEFMQLEGKAALEALPKYREKVEDLRRQALGAVPSQQEKALVAESLTSLSNQFGRYWAGHAAGQMRSYSDKVSGERKANEAAQAITALTMDDEDKFVRHLRQQDMETHNLLDGKGYDRDYIETEARKSRGDTIKIGIETIAAGGDIAKAQSVFDRYHDLMDPQNTLAVTQYLRSGRNTIEGRSVADQETGHAPGSTEPPDFSHDTFERILKRTEGNPTVQGIAISWFNQLKGQANAARIDQERQTQLAKKAEEQKSDAREREVLDDLHSEKPQLTARQIINDPALSRPAVERMIGALERSTKGEPLSRTSHATTMKLLGRMRKPDGDPDKITDIDPIYQEYTDGALSRADFKFLTDEFTHARTPEGAQLDKTRGEFLKRYEQVIDGDYKAQNMQHSLLGTQRMYEFEMDARRQEAELRKQKKDPHAVYDPRAPEFFGRPENIGKYRVSLQEAQNYQKTMEAMEKAAAAQKTAPAAAPAKAAFVPPKTWQYSESRRQYRDPATGNVYDASGRPVKAAAPVAPPVPMSQ